MQIAHYVQQWYAWVRRFGRACAYVCAPPFCIQCRQPLADWIALCDSCTALIQRVMVHDIELSVRRVIPVYAVGRYDGPLKKLILAKSYRDRTACFYAAQLMMQYVDLHQLAIDYIVYIPLHWTRYAKRGYNQAEEIAKHIQARTGIPTVPLIRRVKRTAFQSTCNQADRFTNVQDAFELCPKMVDQYGIKGKRILIVDDVLTTGATVTAVARLIVQQQPSHIMVLVLART